LDVGVSFQVTRLKLLYPYNGASNGKILPTLYSRNVYLNDGPLFRKRYLKYSLW
jgi:hypothetical protein